MVGGSAYVVNADGSEYYAPYRCRTATGEFTLYNEVESRGIHAICIDNDGCLMGGTPHDSQLRSFMARCGNYWFALDDLFNQRYGIDFYALSGFEYTGSPIALSADGRS